MLYDKEVLTVYRADNGGYVIKVREPKGETDTKYPVSGDDDTMHIFTSVAQVLKKIKEELTDEEDGESQYKSSFKQASRQK